MAVRKKAGSNIPKSVRKTVRKTARTMNQFATAAKRRTKTLGRDAEAAVENASEWVGDQASNVGGAIKRNPTLTIAIAMVVGVAGFILGRRALEE